ncbi:MAG: TetR family transcriptional regulator [Micromonosporaceae bacterium]
MQRGRRSGRVPPAERGVRQERKERTRQALLDAGLELVAEHGYAGLSLRQVARAVGIVPTAFYRHFQGLDELGLALVTESFGTLRAMLRSARRDITDSGRVIDQSIEILDQYVTDHEAHFRFIARERSSGVLVIRQAIRWELRLIVSELALDLSRFPILDQWSAGDLQVLAELIVNSMVVTAEGMLDAPNPRDRAAIADSAKKQLRMIIVGVTHWHPA